MTLGGRIVAATLSVVAVQVAHPQPVSPRFEVDVKPVFDGVYATRSLYPVDYEIRNSRGDATVMVQVDDAGSVQSFRVEIPGGSSKRIRVLHPRQGSHVEIAGPGGVLEPELKRAFLTEFDQPVLYIGDEASALRSFALQEQMPNPPLKKVLDFYGTPGRLPQKAFEYGEMKAVVLGPGAERMTNDEAAALRGYVAAGGLLVFSGGPTESALRDPRWDTLLPLANLRTGSKNGATIWTGLSGGLSVTDGDLTAIASRTETGMASRPYGLGQVAVLPFDLSDPEIRRWPSLSEYFRKAVIGELELGNIPLNGGINPLSTIAYHSQPNVGYGLVNTTANLSDSPFELKLPTQDRILTILILYIVLVVPVSYYFLRKLNRGEWAWYSAPAIAAVATGLIFSMSSGLQKFDFETTAAGTITVDPIGGLGSLDGEVSVFYPRAGVKLAPVPNPDFLSTGDAYEYSYSSYGEAPPQFTQDENGSSWTVSSSSASFQALSVKKTIPLKDRVTVRTNPKPDGSVQVTVETDLEATWAAVEELGEAGEVPYGLKPSKSGDRKVFSATLSKAKRSDLLKRVKAFSCVTVVKLSGEFGELVFGKPSTRPTRIQLMIPVNLEERP